MTARFHRSSMQHVYTYICELEEPLSKNSEDFQRKGVDSTCVYIPAWLQFYASFAGGCIRTSDVHVLYLGRRSLSSFWIRLISSQAWNPNRCRKKINQQATVHERILFAVCCAITGHLNEFIFQAKFHARRRQTEKTSLWRSVLSAVAVWTRRRCRI